MAISLPNKSDFGNDIQDRVLEGIPIADLIKDTRLKTLEKFLQEILGKEVIDELAIKWDEFENCRKHYVDLRKLNFTRPLIGFCIIPAQEPTLANLTNEN